MEGVEIVDFAWFRKVLSLFRIVQMIKGRIRDGLGLD